MSKLTAKILSVDKGWNQFQFKIAAAKKPMGVAVGINREQGEQMHEAGVTVATLAHVHEFGREPNHPPMRSFLRSAADSFTFFNSKSFSDNVMKIFTGGGSEMGVLMLVGKKALDIIKARMRAGIEPELADYTVAQKIAKGRPRLTALFDTQKLYRSLGMKIGPRDMFLDTE